MAYKNGHYICDRCGAVCQGIGHDKGWRNFNSGSICPNCLALEEQNKLLKKQNKLIKKHFDKLEREEKDKDREERIEKVGEFLSSSGGRRFVLWLLLWWALIFYYPIKWIVVGIKDKDKNKTIAGSILLTLLVVAGIVGGILSINSNKSLKFEGLNEQITIVYGDTYDYDKGISLKKGGSVVTGDITYSGSVDSYTLGDYVITYTGKYENETITKKVKITVAPFYYDQLYKISILKRFIIEKATADTYTISGELVNESNNIYSKMVIHYYYNSDIGYDITFNEEFPPSTQHFSITVSSNAPLDTYEFVIKYITVRY